MSCQYIFISLKSELNHLHDKSMRIDLAHLCSALWIELVVKLCGAHTVLAATSDTLGNQDCSRNPHQYFSVQSSGCKLPFSSVYEMKPLSVWVRVSHLWVWFPISNKKVGKFLKRASWNTLSIEWMCMLTIWMWDKKLMTWWIKIDFNFKWIWCQTCGTYNFATPLEFARLSRCSETRIDTENLFNKILIPQSSNSYP